MKTTRVVMAGLTAAVAAGVVMLVLQTCESPAGNHASPQAVPTGSRQPVIVGQPRPARVTTNAAPRLAPTADAANAEPGTRGQNEFVRIEDLDIEHPGIAAAYREARAAQSASSLARKLRRCYQRH